MSASFQPNTLNTTHLIITPHHPPTPTPPTQTKNFHLPIISTSQLIHQGTEFSISNSRMYKSPRLEMDTEALILRIHRFIQMDLLWIWMLGTDAGWEDPTNKLGPKICVCFFFEYLLRNTWNFISVFGSSCGLFGHCNKWSSKLIQSVHRSPSKSQIHKSDHKSYPPHIDIFADAPFPRFSAWP